MFSRLKAKIIGSIIGLLAAALLAVTAVTFIPSLSFPFSLPFTRREFTTAHELVLREVRPVFSLSAVEYSYKTVFPYDFLPDDIDPGYVMRQQLRGESLSPAEQETADLLALCRQVGIDLDASAYQFVVIKTRVRGGFRLAGTPWAPRRHEDPSPSPQSPSTAPPSLRSVISLDHARGVVSITLPDPVITSFVIEDETSADYQYPDIEVDPREWKMITKYVRERIEQRVIREGILQQSRIHSQRLIEGLLREAGWKEVRFVKDNPPR